MNSGVYGDKDLISKLTEIILSNLENEKFGVKELAHEAGLRTSVLNRQVKHITQKTINQYIKEVRLKRAMEILLKEEVTASEVAFKVGFGSPSYFSTCFSEYFGYPPGEVKKRGLSSIIVTKEESFEKPVVTEQESLRTIAKLPWWKKRGRPAITFISFIILFILVLIYFFTDKIPGNLNFLTANRLTNHTKSIAVLPFINDSRDPENVYFINGVNEAILDNLAKIKDLEVRPRTSVEKYRNDKSKSTPQIARELGVNYIVEGSGQKIGDQVSLYIQLIETSSDKHLFSSRYNLKLEDIFALQSEVAIKVASEIEVIITFDEKELIANPPTTSVAAWEMYSRGYELRNIGDLENTNVNDRQARDFFKRAIQIDSAYAEPYVQLGWICILYNETDSAFLYADKALHFDSKNSNAYILKGWLYAGKNQKTEAEEAYNLAIQFNPNCSQAYDLLGDMYYNRGDSYKAIKNKLKAIHIESNSIEKRNSLISLWDSFNNVGLYDEAQKYAEKLITLTGDSTYYYWSLLQADYNLGNYESVN
ncbi:helix-turn-helix domain-containing protein, partial [bacterium]|nr:helix-turn-helix domain-containing protein [bacterium]